MALSGKGALRPSRHRGNPPFVIRIQYFGGEIIDKFPLEPLLQCLAIRQFPIVMVLKFVCPAPTASVRISILLVSFDDVYHRHGLRRLINLQPLFCSKTSELQGFLILKGLVLPLRRQGRVSVLTPCRCAVVIGPVDVEVEVWLPLDLRYVLHDPVCIICPTLGVNAVFKEVCRQIADPVSANEQIR